MSEIDFITLSIKKSLETGKDNMSYVCNGDTFVIHSEMNLEEVFEVFNNELYVNDSSLILLDESIDNLIKKNLKNTEPITPEVFDNMEEELIYEYNLYLKNVR